MASEKTARETLLPLQDDRRSQSDSDTEDGFAYDMRSRGFGRNRPTLQLTLFFVSVIFNALALAYVLVGSRETRDVVFDVAKVAIEYEPVVFHHEHSIYVGRPNAGLDHAWRELLLNQNTRITEEEMGHLPGRKDEAVALPDGGYFATLMAWHGLHCVKRLHHYMYEDYYFPNLTDAERLLNEVHNNHCLDMIRQTIMCQGDTQLLTMKWIPEARIPTGNFSSPHKCVNWEKLNSWAASRRIAQLLKPGYLNHPTLGPAYPDGHGDRLGELVLGTPHSGV